MLWRACSFLICQLAGGLAGGWLAGQHGAMAGLVVGPIFWFMIDFARGLRVLRWLRRGDTAGAPAMGGLWGEVVDRTRHALRSRERQTAQSQNRLQEFLAAIQASPNGVLILDAKGRIEWCNQAAAGQFGIDAQRDVLQLIGNLVRDPDFAAYYAGEDYSQELVMTGRSSTPSRQVKLSVQLRPYGEGRKLLLSADITAVEQADIMRRDFVANVSHEIRTPLTVLMGFVETLQNLPLPPEDRARYLGMMAQQSHRMQTLVSDLLTLSRLEGSPLPGAGEWVPVHALAAQVEQEGRALSAVLGKAHELRVGPVPDGELAGAPSELLSAMSNLVSNAVRYTPAGGSIDVRWAALPDGRTEFSVRDSGPGIAPEHLSRLTERFYRVDRSRSRETGGTGLGLAIVKHVVQRHGAELKIESAPGAGSTFAIRFPAGRVRQAPKHPLGAGAEQPATESLPG